MTPKSDRAAQMVGAVAARCPAYRVLSRSPNRRTAQLSPTALSDLPTICRPQSRALGLWRRSESVPPPVCLEAAAKNRPMYRVFGRMLNVSHHVVAGPADRDVVLSSIPNVERAGALLAATTRPDHVDLLRPGARSVQSAQA